MLSSLVKPGEVPLKILGMTDLDEMAEGSEPSTAPARILSL